MQFEYKILELEGNITDNAAFAEQQLNALGKQGWELVQYEYRNSNYAYFILKRRIS